MQSPVDFGNNTSEAEQAREVEEDAVDLKKSRVEAEELSSTLKTVIDAIPDAIWLKNLQHEYLYCNRSFEEFWNMQPGELIGKTDAYIVDDEQVQAYHGGDIQVLEGGAQLFEEARRGHKADGTPVVMDIRKIPVFNSERKILGILGIARDITERTHFEAALQKKEQQLAQLAYFDTLTGLPNRLHYKERIADLLKEREKRDGSLGLLILDLDNFKQINDTLGHAAGDTVLKETAGRLRDVIQASDFVARLSGDEFVILLEDVVSSGSLEKKVLDILAAIEQPIWLEGRWLRISCSIGIAISPEDSCDMEHLLRFADSALYKAKEKGRNTFHFYSRDLSQQALAQLELDSEMRDGLDRGDFVPYFQPKVCLATGKTAGAEALVRWRHHHKGLVSPLSFIPRAEESGLILSIGEQVLRQACMQAVVWNEGRREPIQLAVNISPRQLRAGNFENTLKMILNETGCKPEWIELEITESLLLADNGDTMDLLRLFVDMGISIAIDDFGTGYSALSYLTKFPVKTIKIDRSFVRDISSGGKQDVLVKAILTMAQGLGIQTVAEGIETEKELHWLKEAGCDLGQGYFWSQPVPPDQFHFLG